MRFWLSGVLMRLSGGAERLSFWLTDLSDRMRPRVEPSGRPLTLAEFAMRDISARHRETFADLSEAPNDIFRSLPFKERTDAMD